MEEAVDVLIYAPTLRRDCTTLDVVSIRGTR